MVGSTWGPGQDGHLNTTGIFKFENGYSSEVMLICCRLSGWNGLTVDWVGSANAKSIPGVSWDEHHVDYHHHLIGKTLQRLCPRIIWLAGFS